MVFHLADSMQQLANQIGKRKMKEPERLYIKSWTRKKREKKNWHCIRECAEFFYFSLKICTLSYENVLYA